MAEKKKRSTEADSVQESRREPYEPLYGDLSELNTSPVILNAVGKDLLSEISQNYLFLLESSGAVYEKNGDYALGMFSSRWCRFLDQASRKLCNTKDNKEALGSGKWLCHESCWAASKASIDSGHPVDIDCNGGIRLYAVPIRVGRRIVGSMNFGYGDPPRDSQKLAKIAKKYAVETSKLRELAESYESRPPFIIESAKRSIATSANLIGEIVGRKRTERELEVNEKHLEALLHLAQWKDPTTEEIADFVLDEAIKLTGSNMGFP